MKVFLCLLVWLQVCCCLRDSKGSENYWRKIIRNDKHFGDQDFIERPCSLHDVNCIRRFFAANSKCSPAHGPAPDPYKMKTLPMYIPHTNLTFTMNDIEINGFNDWKIKEFYINKKTDRVILEVEFKRLVVYSDATVIEYFSKGKEPVSITDWSIIEYKSLSLTMTAPHIRNIELSKANVFTYISDTSPRSGLGRNFTESRVPLVRTANRRLLENIGLSLQEAFVTQGPVFMAALVQSSVCDFNLRQVTI